MANEYNQDVELDDNEDVVEAHDLKNAEKQSIGSIKSSERAGPTAKSRKGDKSNSEADSKAKANMISVAHDLMSEMTAEELEDMLDVVMENSEEYDDDEEYDEEEDLDEAALSPEKKKAMKLGYQVGQHGKTTPNRVRDTDVSSRDYKGMDGSQGKGRDRAVGAHLSATKGKGTSGAFDAAAKAARKSGSENRIGRNALSRARSGEDKRQGPGDERAGYFAPKGPKPISQIQRQKGRGQSMAGPSKKLPENYEIDYTDLNTLVESEATLSQEFKAKTALIFEAAVKSTLSEEIDRLEEAYAIELEEEIAATKADLVEKVDSYLNYVVESWMEENKLAIQNGLRTEIAETFMSKLKDLFVESYVEVPESKVDLFDELTTANEELEEAANTAVARAMDLAEELETYKRDAIIRRATKGLAETQVAKLTALVEDIDFENEATFAQKVKTIKESYFSKKTAESNLVDETDDEASEEVSGIMAQYVNAIRKSTN